MTKLFVEQPLALPGPAKKYLTLLINWRTKNPFSSYGSLTWLGWVKQWTDNSFLIDAKLVWWPHVYIGILHKCKTSRIWSIYFYKEFTFGWDLKTISSIHGHCKTSLMYHYIILKNGIFKLNSFNFAILDNCNFQFTKYPVFALV